MAVGKKHPINHYFLFVERMTATMSNTEKDGRAVQ